VVEGIDHRLLDCDIRKVLDVGCFRAITVLDDRFVQIVPPYVVKRFPGHVVYGAVKNLLGEVVAACAFGKPDYVDLRDWEEAPRLPAEEQ
jgi:hypothetical protein